MLHSVKFNCKGTSLHLAAWLGSWNWLVEMEEHDSQPVEYRTQFLLSPEQYLLGTFHNLSLAIFCGPEDRTLLVQQGLLSGSQLVPVTTKLTLSCIGKFQPTKSHIQYPSPTKGALLSRVFFCLLAFPSLQYSSASTLSRTLP